MKTYTAFLFLTLGAAFAGAQGLPTVPRTVHSFSWGDKDYTCLAVDGGVVPLIPPPGATVAADDAIKITWDKDGATVLMRPATTGDGQLLDMMDEPDGPNAWRKALLNTLHGSGYKYTLHEFQPHILGVNHWKIGAISMDYSLAGLKSSSLLLIWRCRDGTTIKVTLDCGADSFKAHCDGLYSMIGGAMVMRR